MQVDQLRLPSPAVCGLRACLKPKRRRTLATYNHGMVHYSHTHHAASSWPLITWRRRQACQSWTKNQVPGRFRHKDRATQYYRGVVRQLNLMKGRLRPSESLSANMSLQSDVQTHTHTHILHVGLASICEPSCCGISQCPQPSRTSGPKVAPSSFGTVHFPYVSISFLILVHFVHSQAWRSGGRLPVDSRWAGSGSVVWEKTQPLASSSWPCPLCLACRWLRLRSELLSIAHGWL